MPQLSQSLFSRASFRQVALAIWHFLLRTFVPARASRPPSDPKRILLINGAHLGDVVIATSLIPVLKSAFPGAQIGFLTASWAHNAVRHHPEIAFTHRVDHWRMNRNSTSFWKKRWRYWQTRQQALKEIREIGYDLSVSMHPWRADFLPLTWQAGIPQRVAFSEGLFAPLATQRALYPEHRRFIHQSDCQLLLLRALGIEERHLRLKRASLAPSTPRAEDEVAYLLGFSDIHDAPYNVIHMGAGSAVREMPKAFWREIAIQLTAHGEYVLFTGKGPREWTQAAETMAGLPNCINACDHLSWEGFVAAIRQAQTFYGVDSMASHVAAAVGTKCIAVYAGMNNLARFRPESRNATVWSNAVPCSACGLQNGCRDMTCLQGFDPHQIVQVEISKPQLATAVSR